VSAFVAAEEDSVADGARRDGCWFSEHDLDGGERILLCSDGLYAVVDDQALGELLAPEDPPAIIVPRLIEAALSRGGRDNVTAVLIKYNGE